MKPAKRILKITGIALGSLLVVLVLMALFTQTRLFKDRLRNFLVSALSNQLNGSLHMGTIDGNFLDGFTIDSLAVYDSTGAFLTTGKISCSYDPLTLLNKKLTMNYFIVEHPDIRFVRSMTGGWNLARLLKPPSDTSKGRFDWTLAFRNLELKGASLSLMDSAALAESAHWNMPDPYVEYHRFTVRDLDAALSFTIHEKSLDARIGRLSFTSPQSGFRLNTCTGELALNEQGLRASGIHLTTGRSALDLDASLAGASFMKGIALESLEHDSTWVRVITPRLDLVELKHFIPQIDFLSGWVSADLEAGGEFGVLNIKHLKLRTAGSSLSLTGTLRNLHKPQNLLLAVQVADSRVSLSDVSALMPPFHIPEFPRAGAVDLTLEFTGKPTSFTTRSSLRGGFGQIECLGSMDLNQHPATYDFTFSTKGVNLGALFGPEGGFRTSLSTKGSISGMGFSPHELSARASVNIDSSSIQDLVLGPSSASASASDRVLEASATLNAHTMQAQVHLAGDYTDSTLTRYRGDCSLSSFDLALLLGDNRFKSSLTLQAAGSGAGRTMDDATLVADMTLLPSVFHGHSLSQENIHVALDQTVADRKHISVESSLADADIQGAFDLELTPAILAHQWGALVKTIQTHASPDSGPAPAPEPGTQPFNSGAKQPKEMNLSFRLALKNLEPLTNVLDAPACNARAVLSGSLRGSPNRTHMAVKGTIEEFYYGTVSGGILFNGGILALEMDSLAAERTLEQLRASLDLSFRSGSLNEHLLDGAVMQFRYDGKNGLVASGARIDSLYMLRLEGNISVQPHTYVFDMDTLLVQAGEYAWRNDQDVQIRLNTEGVRVMHALMRRNDELLSLAGGIESTGAVDATVALRHIDLAGISRWFRNSELARPGRGFTGLANADLRLTGSTASPVFNVSAKSENTAFRATRIGNVSASLSYTDRLASLDVSVTAGARATAPTLTLRGTVPVDLALSGAGERFPDREQKLELRSDEFDLSVLDPLLADVDNLTGTLRCNVTMGGTPRKPRYSGSISLSGVRFLFNANNIEYEIAGTLEPSEDKLILKNFTVKNNTPKGPQGEATFNGSLTMQDFQISSFDLMADGTILLMTEATKKTVPTMYGILFTEAGPEGLNIKGTLQRPFISGKLYIREANLIFPPTKAAAAEDTRMTLNRIIVDDTTTVSAAHRRSKFYAQVDSTIANVVLANQSKESPLLERLRYNLSVETRGTTAVTMIFTPATNEELYAELDGKVTAVNEQGTPMIYGDVEVSPGSSYNFYRRFDAQGKLRFVGQWDNPEMDIQASYEGYRQETSLQSVDTRGLDQKTLSDQQPTEQKVIVELKISGTRYEPKLAMNMKVQLKPGEDPVDWSTQAKGGDPQSDAIIFIVTGKFRDQLTSREQQDFTNIGSATGSSMASNLLSSIFSDVLRKEFPFIRRADVTYQGGNLGQGTSVNVSATAFKGYLRVGGKILNDIGNANVSYQLNMGDVFNTTSIRNLFLEIQRKVEGDNPEDKKLTNEARLYYRFSF